MSKKTTTICFGNAKPIAYSKNPQPPAGYNIEQLEEWAVNVCGLDISGVTKIGEMVQDNQGNPSYQCTEEHRIEFLSDLIAAPFRVPFYDGKQRTTFDFPLLEDGTPQDTISEMLSIVSKSWFRLGDVAPGWIAGEDPFIVQVMAREFGIKDIREWLPQGERNEFPNKAGV